MRVAYGGDEAIELYDEDVDVVLLDRRMPDISGEEVLEDIRKLPGDVAAAMVTSVEPEHDILTMEFDDYVLKPVSENELLEVVDRLISLLEDDEDERRSFRLAAKSTVLNLDKLAASARRDSPKPDRLLEGLVETVSDICSPCVSSFWSFEPGSTSPDLCHYSDTTAEQNGREVLDEVEEFVWQGFSETDDGICTERLPDDTEMSARMSSCFYTMVEGHGVILVLLPSEDGFDDTDEAAVRSAVTMVEASLGRAEKDERIEESRTVADEYEEENRALDRLLNVRERVTEKVLDSATRTQMEKSVCRSLLRSDGVGFVWIGEYIESGDKILCKQSTDDEYMKTLTDKGETEAAKRVARKRQAVSSDGFQSNPPLEPWQEQALYHGFSSVVRAPVSHNASFEGVLTVYLEDSVSDRFVSVVEDIARLLGYAVGCYEAKSSLVSKEVTELSVRVGDGDFPPVRFADETESEVRLKGLSSTGSASQRVYIAVESEADDAVEAVEETARRMPDIQSFRCISDGDGEATFEFTGNPFFFEQVLDHGGKPTEMHATPDEANVTVELPRLSSTTSFLSVIKQDYNNVELVSSRDKEKEFGTMAEFERRITEKLTERQLETLETAYHSGYFDTPRKSTGQDIADQLGVTQPTVTENIKVAEKKVFRLLFND